MKKFPGDYCIINSAHNKHGSPNFYRSNIMQNNAYILHGRQDNDIIMQSKSARTYVGSNFKQL